MCGIIAVCSQQHVDTLLLDGLSYLAHRGYDSAGIALIDSAEQLCTYKCAGKITALKQMYAKNPVQAQLGIGHTRWASSGPANCSNAHPFVSQHIAIVHNGHIENHASLRSQLTEQGYVFSSDSDSEVIAHLIHAHSLTYSDFSRAVQQACQQLKGSIACAILNTQQPQRIWGYRRGSPLILGVGKRQMFIASEPQSLAPLTRQLIFIENGDLVVISANNYHVINTDQAIVQRRQLHLSETTRAPRLQPEPPYSHHTQQEIHQQPELLFTIFNQQNSLNKLDKIFYYARQRINANHFHANIPRSYLLNHKLRKLFKKTKRVHFFACGSSYHAAQAAQYYLEQVCMLPTQVVIASEHHSHLPPGCEHTLLIAISHSGENTDCCSAMQKAQKQPHLSSIAISNANFSSLARLCEHFLPSYSGVEMGVAATKSFSAQLSVILKIILNIAAVKKIDHPKLRATTQQLATLSQKIKETLALEPQINNMALLLAEKNQLLLLGQGIDIVAAREGALKINQLARIYASAHAAGELKHGTLALVEKHLPIIVLRSSEHTSSLLEAQLHTAKARGASILLLTSIANDPLSLLAEYTLQLPVCCEVLSPFYFCTALQLLAFCLGRYKQMPIDQPANIAKLT